MDLCTAPMLLCRSVESTYSTVQDSPIHVVWIPTDVVLVVDMGKGLKPSSCRPTLKQPRPTASAGDHRCCC